VRAKQSTPVKELSSCEITTAITLPTELDPATTRLKMTGDRRGGCLGSEDDTGTEEGEEEEEEEGSEGGSGSSGFHSLPRPPRKASSNGEASASVASSQATSVSATTTGVAASDGPHEERQQPRVPSVDEILCSVKRLRNNHTAMVKSALKSQGMSTDPPNKTFLHGHLSHVLMTTNSEEPSESPFYENVALNGSAKSKSPVGLIYENLTPAGDTHIYDKPRVNIYDTPHALEDEDDIEAVYENINFSTGKKNSDNELSDDSTVYENIEPVSSKNKLSKTNQVQVTNEITYDVPLNSTPIYAFVNPGEKKVHVSESDKRDNLDIASLVPQSTRILLNGRHHQQVQSLDTSGVKDVDQDSLEEAQLAEAEGSYNESEPEDSEPDIPSPGEYQLYPF
jgi:hypothetical protein